MKTGSLVLLILVCLAGCATTRRYESMVDSWNGKTAAELISEWGPPSEVKTLADNTKSYSYVRREKITPPTPNGRTTASEAHTGRISCTTEFLVNADGVITGWTLTGYDCRTK
jgi:hypothetical protein